LRAIALKCYNRGMIKLNPLPDPRYMGTRPTALGDHRPPPPTQLDRIEKMLEHLVPGPMAMFTRLEPTGGTE
jgi:hypothetical protein